MKSKFDILLSRGKGKQIIHIESEDNIMSMIKIGRREIDKDILQQAIKESKRWSEVCDNLGWNSTVRTTVTAIREKAEELGLDTSNIIYNYTKNEDYDESVKNRMKTFNIAPINQEYYDSLETKKNCLAHIRSMMIHAVKNNVNNAVEKVDKNMLIWLI